MGTKQSKESDIPREDDGNIYYLKKKRPGCTGMFWRSDPTKSTTLAWLAGNQHWPRDHASLRGTVVEHTDGSTWLLCSQVRQAGDVEWKNAPVGAAMPFEYDNHYYLDTEAP